MQTSKMGYVFFLKVPGAVTNLLNELGWVPLQRHRLNTRLIAFRKAKKNFISLPMSAHVIYSVKRQFHSNKFIQPLVSSNVYKFSFVLRFLKDWNNLSQGCHEGPGEFPTATCYYPRLFSWKTKGK